MPHLPDRPPGTRSHRRTLALSLLGSAAVHALVLFGVRLPPPERPSRAGGGPDRPLGALRVVEVAAGGEPTGRLTDAEVRPPVPAAAPAPAERADPPDVDGPPVGAEPLPGRRDAPAPADRLRPRAGDPRLRAPPADATVPPRPGDAPDPAAEEARLRARAEAWNRDNPDVRRLPAGDMSAWVTRDDDGGLWGLSPGAIHLGSFTQPLCFGDFDASNCGFGVAPENRDRYRERLRVLVELRRQAEWGPKLERARAIRERADSLRVARPDPPAGGR